MKIKAQIYENSKNGKVWGPIYGCKIREYGYKG